MKKALAAPIQLAPPGAGIPALEVALGKLAFAFFRARKTREWATSHFRTEAGTMVRLARSMKPEAANKPVLIPRVLGIEDSSRNWSVLMTLDHLNIVNSAVVEIIEHLAAERMYIHRVSTAAMKPSSDQNLATIDRFARTTQDYADRVTRIKNLNSATKHAHPWFGPMDALGWHWLASLHHTVHRRQIQRIMAYAK
jgi:hypothetical protein